MRCSFITTGDCAPKSICETLRSPIHLPQVHKSLNPGFNTSTEKPCFRFFPALPPHLVPWRRVHCQTGGSAKGSENGDIQRYSNESSSSNSNRPIEDELARHGLEDSDYLFYGSSSSSAWPFSRSLLLRRRPANGYHSSSYSSSSSTSSSAHLDDLRMQAIWNWINAEDCSQGPPLSPSNSRRREDEDAQSTSDSRLPEDSGGGLSFDPYEEEEEGMWGPGFRDSREDWWVYCLVSSDRKRTYVGVSNDVERRIRQHNGEIAGGAKSSRTGRPWSLLCKVSGFKGRSSAFQFEWRWKHPHTKITDDYLLKEGLGDVVADSAVVARRIAALRDVRKSYRDWDRVRFQWGPGLGTFK